MKVKSPGGLNVAEPSESNPVFPIEAVRAAFPALNRPPQFTFFDNAAGAQVPQVVFDAVNHHLLECNVQRGGRYRKSLEVDEAIARARQSVAHLVNARSANEIAFGMNATSFIRSVSLAIGRTLGERDQIVVTDMDHEANIATWLDLEKSGAKIVWWKVRGNGNLHVDDLIPLVSSSTRLVACTLTSNAIGSIVDVAGAAKIAHAQGAEVFLDGVHFGAHGLIDVRAFDCDYLVCSGYKIFAPHMGFLWGRRESLEQLPTFREDFIPDEPPGKIEAGTFIYENVAGMDAAVHYLETLGQGMADDRDKVEALEDRRAALDSAFKAIRSYEGMLSLEMFTALRDCDATIYGIANERAIGERVPTLCFSLPNLSPSKVTEELAKRDIGVRDGHMYSPRLMRRLGLLAESGAVRASLVHYNTLAEVRDFGSALAEIRKSG
jgi:cysteine desulfurase family protein (TIGR01976 family)